MDNAKIDKKVIESIKNSVEAREEIYTLLREKYKLNTFDALVALIGLTISIMIFVKVPIQSFFTLENIVFYLFYPENLNINSNNTSCKNDSEIEEFLNEEYENPDLNKNRILN